MIFALLGAFLSASTVLWHIWLIPLSFFGINIKKLNGSQMSRFLTKYVKYSSILENGEPRGWIIGKWFIGYTDVQKGDRSENIDLYLLCSDKFYRQHSDTTSSDSLQIDNTMEYLFNDSAFWCTGWKSETKECISVYPTEEQSRIIEQIFRYYKRHRNVTALICGSTGSGKSILGKLVAKRAKKQYGRVSFTDVYDPTQPGRMFSAVCAKANPTEHSPLVVVLEEVDNIISRVHNKKLGRKSQYYPIQVDGKCTWNWFLDQLNPVSAIQKNVILIMTSNMTLDEFNRMDPSYFRPGRVHVYAEMNKPVCGKRIEIVLDK